MKIFGSAHAFRCPRRPMVHDGAAVVSKPLSLEETIRMLRVTPTFSEEDLTWRVSEIIVDQRIGADWLDE